MVLNEKCVNLGVNGIKNSRTQLRALNCVTQAAPRAPFPP